MKNTPLAKKQKGASLIMVLIMLSAIFIVTAFTARLGLLSERSSRNDRDRQSALLAAEAALKDAEMDLLLGSTAANARCAFIVGGRDRDPGRAGGSPPKISNFELGCGSTSSATSGAISTRGLCQENTGVTPLYKSINWEDTSSSRKYATLGEFTGQEFDWLEGSSGFTVKPPKYIIELVPVRTFDSKDNPIDTWGFLITAMGYGLTPDSQAMLQGLWLKVYQQETCT